MWCPESRNATATQQPSRRFLQTPSAAAPVVASPKTEQPPPAVPQITERHFPIFYGDTGHSYDAMFGEYLAMAKEIVIEDPYIRLTHQINNLVRSCETAVRRASIKKILLITAFEDAEQLAEVEPKLSDLAQSLLEFDVVLEWKVKPLLHDREIRLDSGWIIKIGRGLDIHQKPQTWFELGASDLSLRKWLETKVDIYRTAK